MAELEVIVRGVTGSGKTVLAAELMKSLEDMGVNVSFESKDPSELQYVIESRKQNFNYSSFWSDVKISTETTPKKAPVSVAPSDKIFPGALVRLKSGGPVMTVGAVDRTLAECVWYDRDRNAIDKFTFARAALISLE